MPVEPDGFMQTWRVQEQPDPGLAPVPFAMTTLDDFAATAPFNFGLLCHSPSYTPAAADALIPIVGEYIDFKAAPSGYSDTGLKAWRQALFFS